MIPKILAQVPQQMEDLTFEHWYNLYGHWTHLVIIMIGLTLSAIIAMYISWDIKKNCFPASLVHSVVKNAIEELKIQWDKEKKEEFRKELDKAREQFWSEQAEREAKRKSDGAADRRRSDKNVNINISSSRSHSGD